MPISRKQAIDALERHDREIDARLKVAQARVDEAAAVLADAKAIRAGVINEASDAGWSLAKIGLSLGTSRQRVSQLRSEATTDEARSA